jgi:hypothetical protein
VHRATALLYTAGMARVGAALALVWMVTLSASAHAQTASTATSDAIDAGARRAFDEGRDALAAGDADRALAAFREAHRLSGRPELLYNIGLVEDRLRHDRAALEAFQGYLDAIPTADNRASVEDRIRVLREEIARQDAVATALAQAGSQPVQDHGSGGDVFSSPVFWVIVGVVVVGAGVGIGLGVGLSQDPGTAAATPGPSGVVVSALRF